jgi:hypothetical protein
LEAAVLVGVGVLVAAFTGVLLFIAFILVLALARRVQPRHPRHDEPVIVGVLVDLRAVQVVRGQIVLVVVGLRAERQGVVPIRRVELLEGVGHALLDGEDRHRRIAALEELPRAELRRVGVDRDVERVRGIGETGIAARGARVRGGGERSEREQLKRQHGQQLRRGRHLCWC